jgi:hypothetical protein
VVGLGDGVGLAVTHPASSNVVGATPTTQTSASRLRP